MEVEEEVKTDNPEIFLDEDEIKEDSDDEKEENIAKNHTIVELNDITEKANDHLLIGIYGNGSALLKASFFIESKQQNNSYKSKFMFQGKDKSKKKLIIAELHQFILNNTKILILYTKSDLSNQNYKFILNYLKNNNITFKDVMIFNSIKSDNFFSLNKIENCCYHIKTRKCNFNLKEDSCKKLPSPNYIGGFAGYLFTWCDYNDISCIIITSVFNQYDIGLESIKSFCGCIDSFDFLKGKTDNDYFTKNNITVEKINSVFNEFNQLHNSYFS